MEEELKELEEYNLMVPHDGQCEEDSGDEDLDRFYYNCNKNKNVNKCRDKDKVNEPTI